MSNKKRDNFRSVDFEIYDSNNIANNTSKKNSTFVSNNTPKQSSTFTSYNTSTFAKGYFRSLGILSIPYYICIFRNFISLLLGNALFVALRSHFILIYLGALLLVYGSIAIIFFEKLKASTKQWEYEKKERKYR